MNTHDATESIARAKKTPGGHLSIGRGGGTLHYENCRLSGFDTEAMKGQAISAGLPVIDSRNTSLDAVAKLAVCGPMIAVNRPADPRPWSSFAYAPLEVVAAAYKAIGAEVHNVSKPAEPLDLPDNATGPAAAIADAWLAYVRKAA